MKKTRTLISLLTLASAATAAAAPALASCSVGTKYLEYHILNINDIHGAMAGYGEEVVDVADDVPGCLRIAREVNKIKKEYPGTVLLSAGDENSGDCWSVCDHAGTTYPILKAMGVQYAAVGNHAFEWGLDDLSTGRYENLAKTDQTQGKYFVASNILNSGQYQTHKWCTDPSLPDFSTDYTLWENQRVRWADPYKILNFGPATVCLIGLATQNTLVDGNKKVTPGFSFIDYNASIHYAKHLAKQELGAERFNQIDSFILLTHCDSDYKNNVLSGEAPILGGTVDTDIDAIISAHSHKVGAGRVWNNKLNKQVWMAQGGSAGKYLVDTKLIVNPKAPAGKRMADVSMSVHKIPVPNKEHEQEAKEEWFQLRTSTDPDLTDVVNEYENQRVIVEEKVSETVAESKLDTTIENDTQKDKDGKPFDGYYNGLIDHKIHIGHAYYDCERILDHVGGWASRAMILGYAAHFWNDIQTGDAVIPSAAFLTQDSLPANLKSGQITIKNMFALQPYDNYVQLSYLNIMQLANIINYSLAGNPKIAEEWGGKGFSYEDKNQYEPDLCYFIGYENDDLSKPIYEQVAYNVTDDNGKPRIKSGYTCGALPFYGIQMELVEIAKEERDLKFTNPITKDVSPVFDSSAKYRLKTHTSTIDGKTIVLPNIKVYNGADDGHGIKWGSIDNCDDPDKWLSADDWYKLEHPTDGSDPKLIPVLFNSFNYNGGNTQTKMFKEYAQYCLFNYGIQFYTEETPETVRDFIIEFCKNSSSQREWAEYTMPTDISWEKVQKLIKGI